MSETPPILTSTGRIFYHYGSLDDSCAESHVTRPEPNNKLSRSADFEKLEQAHRVNREKSFLERIALCCPQLFPMVSMPMDIVSHPDFSIMGIAGAITHKTGKEAQLISTLWNNFNNDNIFRKIPDGKNLIAASTSYTTKGYYTLVIGAQVTNVENNPNSLGFLEIKQGKYAKFSANGKYAEVVPKIWEFVRSFDFPYTRAFQTDFERYTIGAPDSGPVDIFISIV